MLSEERIQDIKDVERRKYLELNNLSEADCNDCDAENVEFNTEYALLKAQEDEGRKVSI